MRGIRPDDGACHSDRQLNVGVTANCVPIQRGKRDIKA